MQSERWRKKQNMSNEYSNEIKNNQEFQVSDSIQIEYMRNQSEYERLDEKYHFPSFVGEKDLEKSLNLLDWINKHIKHTGNYDNSDRQDALTLLQVAYNKDYGINCLAMSIILCECLLAVDVKARVMYMMPKSANDGDNHVVVEAFISELNKWIMLDPTYGSYCLNSEGEILNLYEMRNYIANNKEYHFSKTINYNGMVVDDVDDVKNYYAKNLFFLRCKKVQGYGQHTEYGNMLEIAPKGFDVHKRMIENMLFRIKTYGNFEVFNTWMKYEEGLENKYIDITSIY